MSIIEDPSAGQIGPLRRVGRMISWILAILLLLVGVISLDAQQNRASWVLTAGVLLAGLAILPPAVDRLRERTGALKSPWGPPLIAFGLFFASAITASLLTAPPTPPPASPQANAPASTASPAPRRSAQDGKSGSQAGW